MYEGIIESDQWFGPLFTNLRFTRSHTPVRIGADFPLAQVQPLPRIAYADSTMGAVAHGANLSSLAESDWAAYRDTIADPNSDPDRPFGAYAVATRKRGCVR